MATEAVTLPEISVGPADAAPDSPALPSSTYANPSVNYGSTSGNGSFTTSGVEAQPNTQPTSTNNQDQTINKLNTVSAGDLPWAIVAMPTTSAGQGGIGNNRHSLQPETWVVGFFLDGDDCQQPIVTHVIPGSAGAGSGSRSSGSSSDGGTTPTDTSGGGDYSNIKPSKANLNQNAKIVYNTLRKGGFTHEQAAGIMGNAQQESGFNPRAHNNIKGGHDGIFQWDSERWGRFKRMFPGRTYDVEAQTQYLVWELNNTEGKYGRLIKMKEHDVTAATIGMANSERFGGWKGSRFRDTGNGYDSSNADLRKRIANAKAIAAQMNNAATTPNRPSTTTTPTTTQTPMAQTS